MKAQTRRAKKNTRGKRAAANAKRFTFKKGEPTFIGRDGVEYPVGLCGFVPEGCKRVVK